ncbi:MAG: S-layer homology domain-containing protein [Acetobacteraceae bacterium]|nr:S-layer homology domain-containing protein [Acetobacteraceae bacterium]
MLGRTAIVVARAAVVLLLAACPLALCGAALAQPAPALADIAGRPDAAAIEAVASKGVLPPVSPGVFDPAGPISRAEFAAATQRTFALPPPAEPVAFADVTPQTPDYAAIEAVAPYVLRARGALCPTCMMSSNFAPAATLPRLQSIALLTQILAVNGRLALATPADSDTRLRDVADAKNLPAPARQLVATALAGGIATLSAAGTLDAATPLDRAGAAVLLDNVITKFSAPHP